MDSILISIKKMLGNEEDYTHFDLDISTGINTAFMILNQLGVGPKEGFSIDQWDTTKTWKDFLGDKTDLQAVKTYVYLKVKLLFDPPSNSFLIDAIKAQIAELEWRILAQVEKADTQGGTVSG